MLPVIYLLHSTSSTRLPAFVQPARAPGAAPRHTQLRSVVTRARLPWAAPSRAGAPRDPGSPAHTRHGPVAAPSPFGTCRAGAVFWGPWSMTHVLGIVEREPCFGDSGT